MMFARSIADDNQVYYDADYAKSTEAGGVIAPRVICAVTAQFDPNFFLRPKIGEEWFGSGKGATSIKKKESSGGGGGGGGCTPSSILNTTGTLVRVMCSRLR